MPVQLVKKGSNKTHLQTLALRIFEILFENNINLNIFWIPRNLNVLADKYSKEIDFDDWVISNVLFNRLSEKWGPVTIDRFANENNSKVKKFNSKYVCKNSSGIDAFSFDWSNEVNWLVPPIHLIPKAITHFITSKHYSKAIMLCPYWTSATYWPLLINKENEFAYFVKEVIIIQNAKDYIKHGNYKKSFIGSEKFQESFIALLLEIN